MMQIREEVAFTKGRIIVRGKLVTRGKAKRADYILYYKPNIPIAIIEAKDNSFPAWTRNPPETAKILACVSQRSFNHRRLIVCHVFRAIGAPVWGFTKNASIYLNSGKPSFWF
jgi:type I site-specific restriction endonuclease